MDERITGAKRFVKAKILTKFKNILANELYLDPKSKFQEQSQDVYRITPHYKVLKETGPDHAKTFEVGLYLGEEVITRGKGSSKQEAQVDAARKGLKKKGW